MSTEDDPILQRGFCLTILEKNWKTDSDGAFFQHPMI